MPERGRGSMLVQLNPISKRAKDRVNQHGKIFRLKQKGNAPLLQGNDNSILVESLNDTWRGQKWLGWFEVDKDVEIIAIDNEVNNH